MKFLIAHYVVKNERKAVFGKSEKEL